MTWRLSANPDTVDQVSQLSLEYVTVGVSVMRDGVPYDPSQDVVQFAFTQPGVLPQTWVTGSWAVTGDPVYPHAAQCLIGPGGAVTLPPGTYTRWVKITDNPEVPVLQAGQVVVV